MFKIVFSGKVSKDNGLKLLIQRTYLIFFCKHSVGKRTHKGHHNSFLVITIILHSKRQHRRRSLCYKYVTKKLKKLNKYDKQAIASMTLTNEGY